MSDLYKLGLCEAQTRMRRGEFTSVELTESVLGRIETLNPTLHAFATPTPELAMDQARAADAARDRGDDLGWLQGIPVALKDLCATGEVPTHAGSLACANWKPGLESTVALRLREGGAVLVGKLTTTEGAGGVHHPDIHPAVNPWNPGYWTGASSSGSGSATAAGLCVASLGSDTGGSIRFPSQCCGLVGLKATWGRVSRYGVFPLAPSLDHVGPMTRRVEDAAAVLEVIAGRDERDPATFYNPVPNYLTLLGQELRPLRVGYDEAFCSKDVNPDASAAISKAVDILRRRGAEIKAIDVPNREETLPAWLVLCGVEAAVAHEETYPERADRYGPALAALLDWGRQREQKEITHAMLARQAVLRDWEEIFSEVDVVISPSTHDPTPDLDQGRTQMRGQGMRRLLRFTAEGNLTGYPTLSLPGGLDERGIPFGYQLVGRPLGEGTILQAGYVIQRHSDWTELAMPPEL